jgi:Alpha/beta hydrolase family
MTPQKLHWNASAHPRTLPRPITLVLALALALALAGCAASRQRIVAYDGPVAKAGVVFVADGAGNFQYASKYIRWAAQTEMAPPFGPRYKLGKIREFMSIARSGPKFEADGTPPCLLLALDVITFDWSHGKYRILADQVDYPHARAEGCRLAQTVLRFQQDHPGVPVHLVGHSAGAMVVLVALEYLPADSVDQVVLLSPSVSATYDLTPALHAVKCGLYNFYSQRDRFYLGLAIGIVGNSDRHWGPSSGRFGFQTPPTASECEPLFAKLHQRPWQHEDSALGNRGGHYGNYQPEFVRAYILPLLRFPAYIAEPRPSGGDSDWVAP